VCESILEFTQWPGKKRRKDIYREIYPDLVKEIRASIMIEHFARASVYTAVSISLAEIRYLPLVCYVATVGIPLATILRRSADRALKSLAR